MREYKVLHLFAGIGGGALGFQAARSRFMGEEARFRTLLGVDLDAQACADFERLTGAPALCADIAELTPGELAAACGGEAPDIVFLSAPCKGFSSLLPKKRLEEEHYQKLNRLMLQGLWLVAETWPNALPRLIVSENVPRIQQRGADLIRGVKQLLAGYGYRFHEGRHDCGEIGGLAQRRRRWLLVARREQSVPTFLYQPPKLRVRAIGEVLERLPMPDDAAGGRMHRLPRLKPMTWIRLALIPAGGDWRALGRKQDGPWRGTYGIAPWGGPSGTVTANGRADGRGVSAVADPRVDGAGPKFNHAFRIVRWDEASVAVAGGTGPSSGGVSVGDPRFTHGDGAHRNKYRVLDWSDASTAVIGATRPGSGAPAVADPRLSLKDSRPDLLGVLRWDRPSKTVSGNASVSGSNCPAACADPRVEDLMEDRVEVPVIVALDGTWHRPLTTLELAALQDLPVVGADGAPLELEGRSQGRDRQAIGNAVPVGAARAIAEQMGLALLASDAGLGFTLGGTPVWCRYREAVRRVAEEVSGAGA